MKSYSKFSLLFLMLCLIGCSKEKAPSNDDIYDWIQSNDQKSITDFVERYKLIATQKEVVASEYWPGWKNAYEYSLKTMLNFNNPELYKMFGAWFYENRPLISSPDNYFYNSFSTASIFNDLPSEVLMQNIKYLNPGWINRAVLEMELTHHIYKIFLTEFNSRRHFDNYLSETIFAVALRKQQNKSVENSLAGKGDVQDYILKYSDLLNKEKYGEVIGLCYKAQSLEEIIKKYFKAYRDYTGSQMEFNEKRSDLAKLLNKNPYGIPNDELWYANKAKTEFDEAKSNLEGSVRTVKALEPQMNEYIKYRTEIENAITKSFDLKSLVRTFDMPL